MKYSQKREIYRIFYLWIPLVLLITFVIIPLFWAVSLSLRTNADIVGSQFNFFPNPPTLESFIYVWTQNKLSIYFFNSIIISVCTISFITTLAILGGYAISRFEFRFKNVFIIMMLMTQMIPSVMNLPNIFLLMSRLRLVNNRLSIILLGITSGIPFQTLLMRGFIGGIPKEVDEAAIIDGCTRIQVIYKIILPVVVPGIVTVMAFAFIHCWNEYLLSYTLFTNTYKFPISVGLRYMVDEFSTNYGALAAGTVIALIPPIAMFGYVQKYLVHGLSSGAVKG